MYLDGTDGWPTRQRARFLLPSDPGIIAGADDALDALPWPQQVLRQLQSDRVRLTILDDAISATVQVAPP